MSSTSYVMDDRSGLFLSCRTGAPRWVKRPRAQKFRRGDAVYLANLGSVWMRGAVPVLTQDPKAKPSHETRDMRPRLVKRRAV